MQYGFIGVGQMGGGLARNLIRAKKNVWVFDLNPEAVKATLAAGTTGRAAAKSKNWLAPTWCSPACRCPSTWSRSCWGRRGFSAR